MTTEERLDAFAPKLKEAHPEYNDEGVYQQAWTRLRLWKVEGAPSMTEAKERARQRLGME